MNGCPICERDDDWCEFCPAKPDAKLIELNELHSRLLTLAMEGSSIVGRIATGNASTDDWLHLTRINEEISARTGPNSAT